MARPLSWSDVRGGAIATVLIAIVALVILKYSRLGELHGDTFRLTAFVGEARGVLVGSEVWLSGQKIGKIIAIRFRPPASNEAERVEIDMELLERYRSALRADAVAQIRNGGTIIGAPVVYLSAGTINARELRANDTIRTRPQADLEAATGKFGAAAKELPYIVANLKTVAVKMQSKEGTAGAFLNAPGGPGLPQLARTRAELSRLQSRLHYSSGAASTPAREDLVRRAKLVMSHVDSVRALVASPNTSLGRLKKDSTLLNEVADIRVQLAKVRTAIDSSSGTAGRLMNDSAIVIALGGAQREMAALFADIKKHPLRYIRF